MIELIGWAAALALLLSGVPVAIDALRTGKVSMPMSTPILVMIGMLGMLAYEALSSQSLPQMIDFGFNGICWVVVLFYKIFPRGAHE